MTPNGIDFSFLYFSFLASEGGTCLTPAGLKASKALKLSFCMGTPMITMGKHGEVSCPEL